MAARLLARRAMTEAELEQRLIAKGYRPATAAATLARCRELGYVGDAALARERARAMRARGAGSLKIAVDLAARGLPEALIEDAVRASLEGENEAAWAARALGRRRETRQAWRFLAARGFPEEVIEEVLGQPT